VKYLVDTDRAIDWLNGRPEAVEFISALAPEGLGLSLLSLGELWEGIHFSDDPMANERGLRRFLRIADVLPLNRAIMKRFAQIRGQLRRDGNLIGDMDILIAATALHHDLVLLTRNVRHFERIPGVQLG